MQWERRSSNHHTISLEKKKKKSKPTSCDNNREGFAPNELPSAHSLQRSLPWTHDRNKTSNKDQAVKESKRSENKGNQSKVAVKRNQNTRIKTIFFCTAKVSFVKGAECYYVTTSQADNIMLLELRHATILFKVRHSFDCSLTHSSAT